MPRRARPTWLVHPGRLALALSAACLAASALAAAATAGAPPQAASPCAGARDHVLPRPSAVDPDAFHDELLAFLEGTEYVSLGWCHDKEVRDTGPFVDSQYLGTHPAVRVYYSPAVMRWLEGGRQGALPDGAMIVKEMYAPGPAARWQGQPTTPASWTVMVKDAAGSKDGWFWGGLWSSDPPMPKPGDSLQPPFEVVNEGFGLACLHCHASAESEMTFASLANVEGYPGTPITYFVDDSWRTPRPSSGATTDVPLSPLAPTHRIELGRAARGPHPDPRAGFVASLGRGLAGASAEPQPMVPETADHVVAPAGQPTGFVTSDQCMGCHSGNAWYGQKFTMIVEPRSDNPVNVSPYGEWRWSAMGLAGRDPIFYAQLESELAYLDGRAADQQTVVNMCLRCHGVMGKRQLDADHGYDLANPTAGTAEPDFDLGWITGADPAGPGAVYGDLARDGVSCAACHRIVRDPVPDGEDALAYFLARSTTGRFTLAEPGTIYGPFEDDTISPHPMKESLGLEPKFDPYIKDSRMCGHCHTIELPVMDRAPFGHSLEQVTYLEWLNSAFQTEFSPGPDQRSCQGCHMPTGYTNARRGVNVGTIQAKFADVQDDSYPGAEHLAPFDRIRARFRDTGFVRHQLQGLNAFLLEMFSEFMTPDASTPPNESNRILGVRKSDYMSTLDTDLRNAIDNFEQAALHETATVEIVSASVDARRVSADVRVTNLTGHRFPTGVGFRRAFLQFDIVDTGHPDASGEPAIVWSSGRTNEIGQILGGDGQVLPSEYIGTARNRRGAYQRHFGAGRPITDSGQVQIYEELTKDARGDFTTSFLRRDHTVKDNRLLPRGWTATGPTPSLGGEYLASTFPEGDARNDPRYADGSGTSVVRYEVALADLPAGIDPARLRVKATMHYQSIPPYYLEQRFEAAPEGAATRRLYYLASRLDTRTTLVDDWTLLIATTPAVSPAPR